MKALLAASFLAAIFTTVPLRSQAAVDGLKSEIKPDNHCPKVSAGSTIQFQLSTAAWEKHHTDFAIIFENNGPENKLVAENAPADPASPSYRKFVLNIPSDAMLGKWKGSLEERVAQIGDPYRAPEAARKDAKKLCFVIIAK